jgi:hypothetical protein
VGKDMGKIQDGKWLYHLTKLSNLDSIIEHGLMPRKMLCDNETVFADVADPGIMTKRKQLGLDKYVPFHFHPYSSFDVAVKNANKSEEFIYICIKRTLARDKKFLIIPRHPLNMPAVELYEYDEGIQSMDWGAMERSSSVSEYIKEVRMAECMTEDVVPVNWFAGIAVRTEGVKQIVEGKLYGISGHKPYINVRPWLNV